MPVAWPPVARSAWSIGADCVGHLVVREQQAGSALPVPDLAGLLADRDSGGLQALGEQCRATRIRRC